MALLPQTAIFLFCALVVSGASCPSEEDLFPCKCQEKNGGLIVSCVGKFLSQLHVERALGRMRGKEIASLQLQHIEKLGTLKGDLFSTSKIRSLSIFRCGIDALTDGNKPPFSGLEDSLEGLFIVGSLKSSSSLQLSHLRNVKTLNVFDNQFSELKARFPASVTSMVLSNNEIRNIPDRAFDNLSKLNSFALDRNQLKTFHRNWLPQSKSELNFLDLNGNLLTSLPRDAFSNLPSLQIVFLDNNRIRGLEKESWAGVWPQLYHLKIEGNPLVCDSNMKWILQMEKGPSVHGKCQEPANLKGMDIEDFLSQASPERNHPLE